MPDNCLTLPRRQLLPAALLLLGVAACGGSGTSESPAAGLTVVSGAGASDTVDAPLSEPLVVRLGAADGSPVANATVVFSGVGCPAACTALVVPADQPAAAPAPTLNATTDAAGEARVLVHLTGIVGTAGVTVMAGSDSVRASFSVLAGAPAAITLTPKDTGTYVSRTLQYHGTPTDRYGHPALGTTSVTSLDNAIASVNATGQVTAHAVGIARIVAQAGSFADTTTLVVVPTYTVAINLLNGTVARMGLDGQVFGQHNSGGLVESVDWVPGGTSLVYSRISPDGRIYTTAGTRVTKTDTLATNECYAELSADGGTLYFSAQAQGGLGLSLFRVKMDGTGLAPVAAGINVYEPDVAPDNDRVAFAPVGAPTPCGIAVLTQSTGNITCLHQQGILPRWSPDGQRIAWLTSGTGGDLSVMHPDGTGVVRLSDGVQKYYEGGPNWSPDGQWIAVTDAQLKIELIRVSDGLRLPLRWLPAAGWIVFQR